ncbi:MAG: zinc-finger domain-containing protein [Thiogranum sp.]
MPSPNTAADAGGKIYTQANAENRYEVTQADLPLHCPMDSMSLWNSHPRVYLPIDENGRAKCPYCGADYFLQS